MTEWRIHHKAETVSTNLDARAGSHGDVFTADFQTAGRGRLDHRWLSPPKTNLMMSVVLSVGGLSAEHVVTLPLVIGLAVCDAVREIGLPDVSLKWPNDVLVDGRKLAGILCERHGDGVVAGIGVNVAQREFPPEIAARATSLVLLGADVEVGQVREAVLSAIGRRYAQWREGGFLSVREAIAALDGLKGRMVSVRQTDGDAEPVRGVCGGINADGTLDVGGRAVCAGEAHVESIGTF